MARGKKQLVAGAVLAVLAIGLLLWLVRADVAWAWTTYLDTSEAYRSYAEAWPQSDHRPEALARQDARDWERASADASLPALQEYLDRHPSGRFAVPPGRRPAGRRRPGRPGRAGCRRGVRR